MEDESTGPREVADRPELDRLRDEVVRLRAEVDAILSLFVERDGIFSGIWWAIDATAIFDHHSRASYYRVFHSRDEAISFIRRRAGLED